MKEYYYDSINRAIKFIQKNLDEPLKLDVIAREGGFSPFHFQRIFKSITGENPYEYILRKRLEKAVFYFKHGKKRSVTEVAFACGFPSPENFSRQFKTRYGVSPSYFIKNKTIHQDIIYRDRDEGGYYHIYEESRKISRPDFKVKIENWEDIPIYSIRAIFGADGKELMEAYQELMSWCHSHQISYGEMRRFGMSIDDPAVTPFQKYRYDFAVHIPTSPQAKGKIEQSDIPRGTFVTLDVQGDITRVAQAWDYLYGEWLPQSEYVPRHFPAIEEFLKGPEEIGWTQFDIKCAIPIEKY